MLREAQTCYEAMMRRRLTNDTLTSSRLSAGVFLLVLIAVVNVYTSDMLIRQCRITGTIDYDTLAYAVGGPIWRVSAARLTLHDAAHCHHGYCSDSPTKTSCVCNVSKLPLSTLQFISQFGIVILLLGTLAGGVSQIGEAFSYGLLLVSTPPEWLTNGTGRCVLRHPWECSCAGKGLNQCHAQDDVMPPTSANMPIELSSPTFTSACRMLMVICVLVIVAPMCLPNNLTSVRKSPLLCIFALQWAHIVSWTTALGPWSSLSI